MAQPRTRMGVERSAFRVAPVKGLPGARMAQDAGTTFPGAALGEPGPGEEACAAADEIRPVGGHGVENGGGGRLHRPVLTDRPSLLPEAARQASGVAIAAPRTLGRLGVESPEVSSAGFEGSPNASRPMVVCRGGGLHTYHRSGADAVNRAAHAWRSAASSIVIEDENNG